MTRDFQLFELARFVENRLAPAAEVFEASPAGSTETEFLRGELYESVWWLHLGVETGCYPSVEAALLLAHYRNLLERDYQNFIQFHSWRFATRLLTWINAAVSGREALPELDNFPPDAGLLAQFQASLLLSDHLIEDAAAKGFLRAQTFANDEEWTALLDHEASSKEADAMLRQTQPDRGSVAGFFRALGHMDASRQFFEDLDQSPLATVDLVAFRRRIGQIQVWRQDFSNGVVQMRFEQMESKAEQIVRNELSANEGVTEDATKFRDAAFYLMTTWKQNYTRGLATATA